jgi:hypothetical protein
LLKDWAQEILNLNLLLHMEKSNQAQEKKNVPKSAKNKKEEKVEAPAEDQTPYE